ncbi:EAL domain-containing protein [Salirhabdus salicampi]|uniref:EAL domain-containing protein n=1 Tax=Salirhabdus salicampi TaxID=476102 RepID=UPI0020C564E9|nr:EAL domain-containing protein [Salirhabdus salicampi]MCP8615782.1 EAL domain-containing protein [Salirhabdus salicampi]
MNYKKYSRRKDYNQYKKFTELQKILRHEMLHTFFQPVINLQTGQNVGYEILNRPPSSYAFPNTESFFDYIGQTNQVFQVEQLCRKKSLEMYSNSCKKRHINHRSLIFINVHPQVLTHTNYKSGTTLNLLKKFNISPNQIVFELTEKTAVTDYDHFTKVLANYRSQGFRIAIDDAGSGYNSLQSLVYIKPEFIKLDKTLIRCIDQDRVKQQLLKLLIDFANQSNTTVIAEGIERFEELMYLRQHRVHMGQGYAIGKPSSIITEGKFPKHVVEKRSTSYLPN